MVWIRLALRAGARPSPSGPIVKVRHRNVDTVNTNRILSTPVAPAPRKPARKPSSRYHHGDLRRALVEEAARTMRDRGIDRLTLRAVGQRLGVSRSALYRHFADKSSLLAAVAREGFQTFRRDLVDAWETAGGGRTGFQAMGAAYVRFARVNPSHYRVMFGGFRDLSARDPELAADAAAAFQVLVDALVSLQRSGLMRSDDPQELGRFIWATVHGVAMLAIDGQLGPEPSAADALVTLVIERLARGLGLNATP
jgi:AcrR family transcriptional regulator